MAQRQTGVHGAVLRGAFPVQEPQEVGDLFRRGLGRGRSRNLIVGGEVGQVFSEPAELETTREAGECSPSPHGAASTPKKGEPSRGVPKRSHGWPRVALVVAAIGVVGVTRPAVIVVAIAIAIAAAIVVVAIAIVVAMIVAVGIAAVSEKNCKEIVGSLSKVALILLAPKVGERREILILLLLLMLLLLMLLLLLGIVVTRVELMQQRMLRLKLLLLMLLLLLPALLRRRAHTIQGGHEPRGELVALAAAALLPLLAPKGGISLGRPPGQLP